ncbi:hypothetical protein [Sphingopyxis terrae]|uniref:hypothetical protein n=1 Tax=Sphingopyxis terrae TaxID=33052 RepID=UPI001C2C6FA3|nr:hypothetical protein [Sphingopyxis terrae]QXF12574.1 hypothetical protein HBA51_10690 [Sphingopyxis terrae subsp. terrae]
MQALEPTNSIERLFIPAAATFLPAREVEIIRLNNGALRYSWQSPCSALECLNAHILESEIMLSTKISHTHIEGWRFGQGELNEDQRAVRIAVGAIKEILEIMDGDLVFTKDYDSAGNELTSSGMSPRNVWLYPPSDMSSHKSHTANGVTERAWDWFGEVTRPKA